MACAVSLPLLAKPARCTPHLFSSFSGFFVFGPLAGLSKRMVLWAEKKRARPFNKRCGVQRLRSQGGSKVEHLARFSGRGIRVAVALEPAWTPLPKLRRSCGFSVQLSKQLTASPKRSLGGGRTGVSLVREGASAKYFVQVPYDGPLPHECLHGIARPPPAAPLLLHTTLYGSRAKC